MSGGVGIGDRFVCVHNSAKALLEVSCTYFHDTNRKDLVCCRILKGTMKDANGVAYAVGAQFDMPLERVALAVTRYRLTATE